MTVRKLRLPSRAEEESRLTSNVDATWLSASKLQSEVRSQCRFWTASTQFVQHLGRAIRHHALETSGLLQPILNSVLHAAARRPDPPGWRAVSCAHRDAPRKHTDTLSSSSELQTTRTSHACVPRVGPNLREGAEPRHCHVDRCTARGTHLSASAFLVLGPSHLQQGARPVKIRSFLEPCGFPTVTQAIVKLKPLEPTIVTSSASSNLGPAAPRNPQNWQACLSGVCDLAAQASELQALSSKRVGQLAILLQEKRKYSPLALDSTRALVAKPHRSVNDAETGGLRSRTDPAMVSCVALGEIGSARTVLSTWPPRRPNLRRSQ